MDVAIIGAGPAGLSTAYHLEGLEAVVFESTYSPRSKPCAGLIQKEAFEEFPIIRTGPRVAIDKIIVSYNDRDFEVEFEEPIAYVVERETIGWNIAGRMDAELELGARVFSVERRGDRYSIGIMRSDGEREYYEAKYLVGADGVFSIVRRKLFDDRISDDTIGIAHQAIVAGYYKPRIFLGRYAPKGYARVYPAPNSTTRIGIGTLKRYSKGIQDKLFEILGMYEIETYTPQFGYVPLLGVIKESVRDRAILVGDAAAQVQPINGIGIIYALRAGKLAAEAIMRGDPMRYEKAWRNKFGGELSLGRKALLRGLRGGRLSKHLARVAAEILLGRVTRVNLLKARILSRLGL